jgi:hypothetical protein
MYVPCMKILNTETTSNFSKLNYACAIIDKSIPKGNLKLI